MLTFSSMFANCNQNTDGFQRLSSDTYSLSNATYDVSVNKVIFIDTNNGNFSIRFPSVVEPGDVIVLVDIGGNLKLEHVTISNLGKLFGNNVTQPIILDKRFSISEFIYVSLQHGWILKTNYLNITGSDNPISLIPTQIYSYTPNSNSSIIASATSLNDADVLLNNAILQLRGITVKSINNLTPDANGNVSLTLGGVGTVTSVNNVQPVSGNVNIPLNAGTVTSVNNVQPVNGNVSLALGGTGTVTSVNNISPVNGNVTLPMTGSVKKLSAVNYFFF